jgi:hypothetical protein
MRRVSETTWPCDACLLALQYGILQPLHLKVRVDDYDDDNLSTAHTPGREWLEQARRPDWRHGGNATSATGYAEPQRHQVPQRAHAQVCAREYHDSAQWQSIARGA